MKALVLDVAARAPKLRNIPKPTPGPDEILIEVKAIALNPIDPLYSAHPLAPEGSARTIGSDFAGIVAALPSSHSERCSLKLGDRVAGFLQGACSRNDRPGAFAEFVAIPWDLVWSVPENVTSEEAAGVSLVALTAAQGMWYRLGLPAPFEYDREAGIKEHEEFPAAYDAGSTANEGVNVLVYSAATSVGLYAAQLARVSSRTPAGSQKHFKLFGTASQARWNMLKAPPYAYDHLISYRDEAWPQQVRELSGEEGMHYIYDSISEGETVRLCASTFSKQAKGMAIVRSREAGAWTPYDNSGHDAPAPVYGAVWEGLGFEVEYQKFTLPASKAARAFAVEFYKWLGQAMGKEVLPVPVRIMPGGLEKVVEDGFVLLGTGTMEDRAVERREEWMRPVGGEKLVYHVP